MKNSSNSKVFGLQSMAILVFTFFAFSLSSFSAPESVDFSGKWVLNESKSVLGERAPAGDRSAGGAVGNAREGGAVRERSAGGAIGNAREGGAVRERNAGGAMGAAGERGPAFPGNMTVTQDKNILSIERTITNREGQKISINIKYNLDGKPSENVAGRGKATSVASWSADGKKLSINTKSLMERDGQKIEMTNVDVWELSADGKTLTVNTTAKTPRGERKVTLVYDKQ
jgi:hypothetical protein